MTSRAGTNERGFTLLEVLVVVTILGILFGVMTPLFRSSYTNLQLRDAYKNVRAAFRHAQERAIMEEREFRVNVDDRSQMYWLSYRDDPMKFPPQFVNLESGTGGTQALPEGVRVSFIKANRDRDTGAHYVTFYPNGAADRATVRFRDVNHGSLLIETGRELGTVSTKEK